MDVIQEKNLISHTKYRFMSLSNSEENYLKAIFKLSIKGEKNASTNDIAESVQTKAASVTDMLKKLAEKELIIYEKYKGVSLTAKGDDIARKLVRNHRLWEVFLVEKLGFKWDEVHPIAEQMEHVYSVELIQRLDAFLGFPKYDPHGDPIPNEKGIIEIQKSKALSELKLKDSGIIVGVKDSSASFLKYLDSLQLNLGVKLLVKDRIEFDSSMIIETADKRILAVSQQIAKNILVK